MSAPRTARCQWCGGKGRYYVSECHFGGDVQVVEDYVRCRKCEGTGLVPADSPYAYGAKAAKAKAQP